VRKRDTEKFDRVNKKLMENDLPLTSEEEEIYCREMVNSPKMYKYIREKQDEYSLFVFIPYMFGTTYYGIQACPQKSVVIPCLHDESYIYMNVFKDVFKDTAGMIFHAEPEKELAQRVYDLSNVNAKVLGGGVDTDMTGYPVRFIRKYGIKEPFILYAGRKDAGKNVGTLLEYFARFKKTHNSPLKLVLIGGGEIEIPEEVSESVVDLGFIPKEDKFDAYAAARFLCQPSHNESFSLVMMESWLCRRPVLVSGYCNVTKHFVKDANAGLYFTNYYEFEKTTQYMLAHPQIADQMGKNGREYVMNNFAWNVITRKYIAYFKELSEGK
jgi:glycosyltransferase involved in cell wall biosynthesis